MTDSTLQEAKSDDQLIEDFWVSQGGKPHDKADIWFYGSSWDMLMPVVEKIENMVFNQISFNVEISRSFCEIAWTVRPTGKNPPKPIKFTSDDGFGRYSKIETVYKAVVEFIKWHNSQ